MLDCLIALSDNLPRSVRSPLVFGALRTSTTSSSWKDDAVQALRAGRRLVLSGNIENLVSLANEIRALKANFPDGEFALLTHWSQALIHSPSDSDSALFENVYVVVDAELERPDLQKIQQAWQNHWVLIPTEAVRWSTWIPNTLFPNKRGALQILSPPGDEFLSADELRLRIDQLSYEHPLIEIFPAPCEWFLPMELNPWRESARDLQQAVVVRDTRRREKFDFSVIVPLRLGSDARELIETCLRSVAAVFLPSDHREIILVLDGNDGFDEAVATELADVVIVRVPRVDEEDWRVGFIRNCGARHARNSDGTFLFLDADVAIARPEDLRRALRPPRNEILQLSRDSNTVGFKTMVSGFLAIKSSVFKSLGGFADAFSNYGGEDHFLIWKAQRAHARIQALSMDTIRNLRAPAAPEDLALKSRRLHSSADLLYRMTLDPDVHRHFYVSLGADLWTRTFARRLISNSVVRFLLAPLVFFITLVETDRKLRYVVGFYDAFVWKFKRPILRLRPDIGKNS